MLSTIFWFVGLLLVIGSFGFLLHKPRQNGKPRITIE